MTKKTSVLIAGFSYKPPLIIINLPNRVFRNKSIPMKYLFLVLFISIGAFAYSQDILILKTGDEQPVKVLEVGINEIKYKKFDNLEGPVYTILKSDVFMIKYKNGGKDVFGYSQNNTGNLPVSVEQKDFLNAFEIKQRGYCGMAETGTDILVSNNGNYPIFSFLFFNGGRLSRNFAIGFETGIYLGVQGTFIVPATVSMRVNFFDKRVTPFFEFNAGFNYLNSGQNYNIYSNYYYGSNQFFGGTVSASLGGKVWVVKQVALTMRIGYTGFFEINNGGAIIHGVPVMLGVEF